MELHIGAHDGAPGHAFPRLAGSHLSERELGTPALAFVRAVCHLYGLDAAVTDEVCVSCCGGRVVCVCESACVCLMWCAGVGALRGSRAKGGGRDEWLEAGSACSACVARPPGLGPPWLRSWCRPAGGLALWLHVCGRRCALACRPCCPGGCAAPPAAAPCALQGVLARGGVQGEQTGWAGASRCHGHATVAPPRLCCASPPRGHAQPCFEAALERGSLLLPAAAHCPAARSARLQAPWVAALPPATFPLPRQRR